MDAICSVREISCRRQSGAVTPAPEPGMDPSYLPLGTPNIRKLAKCPSHGLRAGEGPLREYPLCSQLEPSQFEFLVRRRPAGCGSVTGDLGDGWTHDLFAVAVDGVVRRPDLGNPKAVSRRRADV